MVVKREWVLERSIYRTVRLSVLTSDREPLEKPIFVVGAPRSGTTLLQAALASHPDCFSLPETNFFSKVTPALIKDRRSQAPIGKRPIRICLNRNQAVILMKDLEVHLQTDLRIVEFFREQNDLYRIVDLFRHAISLFNSRDVPRLVEKTPKHVFFAKEIYQLFPDAKIVNIVRDPRDFAPSLLLMVKKMNRPRRSLYSTCRIWRDSVKAAQKADLHTVRYEDMVENPATTLKKLFAFLELDYRDDRVSFDLQLESVIIRPDEKSRRGARLDGVLDKTRIGSFKDRLSPREVGAVEAYCAEEMKQFGYLPITHGRKPLTTPLLRLAHSFGRCTDFSLSCLK